MRLTVLSSLLVLIAAPAMAGPDDPGRYQILSVSGGFVRLDTVSGATTFCRDEVDSFRCSAIPIAAENQPSKAEAGATRSTAPDDQATTGDSKSSDDLDKALTFMERTMRSLMAITQEKTPECAL